MDDEAVTAFKIFFHLKGIRFAHGLFRKRWVQGIKSSRKGWENARKNR